MINVYDIVDITITWNFTKNSGVKILTIFSHETGAIYSYCCTCFRQRKTSFEFSFLWCFQAAKI